MLRFPDHGVSPPLQPTRADYDGDAERFALCQVRFKGSGVGAATAWIINEANKGVSAGEIAVAFLIDDQLIRDFLLAQISSGHLRFDDRPFPRDIEVHTRRF